MAPGTTYSIGWEPRPDHIGVLRVLHAAGLLVLARLALVALGFRRTASLVRFLGRGGGAPPVDVDLARVRASTYTVALAAAFVPARILCLERSLVLYHQLRRSGVPVSLRLGVRAFPFAAHAWVELEGSPLNETAEVLKDFQPIFEQA